MQKTDNNKKNSLLFLKLYIFLVIYTPLIVNNNFINKFTFLLFIFFINLIPILIKREKDFFSFFLKKKLFFLIIIIFISSIYSLFVTLIKDVPINSIVDTRIIQNNVLNILILNIVMIYYKCKKLNLSKNEIIKLLIDLASIQGVICILMVIIPPFKNVANYLYLVEGKYNIFVLSKRIYGISNDYTFGTQIYHGIIAGLIFDKILSDNKKYYINLILVLISIVLNGRTGILMFIIMSVYFLIRSLSNKDLIKKIFRIITISISLIILFVIISFFVPKTYNFIVNFFNQTISFVFDSKVSGNYDILFNDMLYFPKGLELIFGAGHTVYGAKALSYGYIPSDIGYVNDIFAGGIIYVFMLYLPIFKNILSDKKYGLILTIILLISNLKGEIFKSIPVMFIVLLIIIINIEGVENNGKS